jgi:phage terminase large subunit
LPVKTVQLDVEFTDRQDQADDALACVDCKRLLYGGAKGGGKSWFLCVWAFLYAYDIASKFGLLPSKNPIHIGWIGRKQAVDFTATTLQTWRQVIPEEYYEIKGGSEKDPKHILIKGRIAIDFGGLDKTENINKFNSAEYGFFALDQAEETLRDEIAILRGSLRLKIQGQELPYKELYTANPASCWLKDEFITTRPDGNVFIPALPTDNPHLPAQYTQTLIDAFGYRQELLEAYLYGSWSSADTTAQIILDSWLNRAEKDADSIKNITGKIVACDPARFGDDETKILVLDGSHIIEKKTLPYSRTTETSNLLWELSKRHNNCAIVVDEIGVGGGVVDELHERGRKVISFNSSEKADNPDKFYNRRAEAWWLTAELLAKSEIGIKGLYPELKTQLTNPRYDFRNGKIIVEAKEEIKARLGRSPDDADCFIMGIWAVKKQETDSSGMTPAEVRNLHSLYGRKAG